MGAARRGVATREAVAGSVMTHAKKYKQTIQISVALFRVKRAAALHLHGQ